MSQKPRAICVRRYPVVAERLTGPRLCEIGTGKSGKSEDSEADVRMDRVLVQCKQRISKLLQ